MHRGWLALVVALGCSSGAPGLGVDAGDGGAPDADAGTPPAACLTPPVAHGNLGAAWAEALGNGTPGGMLVAPSGQIIVAGSFVDELRVGGQIFPANPGSQNNAFLLALDGDGHLAWERTFATNWTPMDLGADAAGNLYAVGSVNHIVNADDFGSSTITEPLILAKFDPRGNTVWARGASGLLSGTQQLSAVAIGVSPDGQVALMGAGLDETFVALVDQLGALVWARPVADSLLPSAVAFDDAGDILIAGRYSGAFKLASPPASPTFWRGFVVTLDMAGNEHAIRTLGPGSDVTALAGSRALMAGGFNGGLALDGATAGGHGLQDLFLASLDGGLAPSAAPVLATFASGGDRWDAVVPAAGGGAWALLDVTDFVDLGAGLLTPPALVMAHFDAGERLTDSIALDAPFGARGRSIATDQAGNVVAFGGFEGAADLGTGPLDEPRTFVQTLFVAKYTSAPPTARGAPQPCPPLLREASLWYPQLTAAPKNLLVQGDTVYFTSDGEVFALGPSDVGRFTVLAYAQKRPVGLASDAQSLYWAAAGTPSWQGPGGDGTIASMSFAGGPITVLARDQQEPGPPAVDDASVYWMAGGPGAVSLMAMPKAGGVPVALVTGLPGAGPVAAGSGLVAFATGAPDAFPQAFQIQVLALAGGGARPLATTDRRITSLAMDGATVFWTDANSLTVDATADDGRIRSVPLDGSSAAVVLADKRLGPAFITIVGDYVSWGELGSDSNGRPGNNGGVWALGKNGAGALVPVARDLPLLLGFADDGSTYAWVQSVDVDNGTWALQRRIR